MDLSDTYPLFRRGMEMVTEGWEPLLQRTLLERQKEAVLRDLETRYDMMIDGFDALVAGDWPEFVEAKLKAYTKPT